MRSTISEKEIECFIPAQAIEFHGSPDSTSLKQKLKMAIARKHLTGSFFEDIYGHGPIPTVIVYHQALNPEELGYWVWAVIRC